MNDNLAELCTVLTFRLRVQAQDGETAEGAEEGVPAAAAAAGPSVAPE